MVSHPPHCPGDPRAQPMPPKVWKACLNCAGPLRALLSRLKRENCNKIKTLEVTSWEALMGRSLSVLSETGARTR